MTRKLRIEFRHMMVFFGQATGMTVLLPVFEHRGTLKQHAHPNKHFVAVLDRAVVEVLRDGKPLTGGGKVVCERNGFLVHAREALGPDGDVAPLPDFLNGPVRKLNARILLPGPGSLEALEGECDNYPPAANAKWIFTRPDRSTHVQRLSDRVVYTFPFSDEHRHEIRVSGPMGTWTFDVSQGTSFVVSNADENGKHFGGPFNKLTEFPKLYQLLDLPTILKANPLPPPETHDLPETRPEYDPKATTPDVACCDPLICGETHE